MKLKTDNNNVRPKPTVEKLKRDFAEDRISIEYLERELPAAIERQDRAKTLLERERAAIQHNECVKKPKLVLPPIALWIAWILRLVSLGMLVWATVTSSASIDTWILLLAAMVVTTIMEYLITS